jgi:hypothetical protein
MQLKIQPKWDSDNSKFMSKLRARLHNISALPIGYISLRPRVVHILRNHLGLGRGVGGGLQDDNELKAHDRLTL